MINRYATQTPVHPAQRSLRRFRPLIRHGIALDPPKVKALLGLGGLRGVSLHTLHTHTCARLYIFMRAHTFNINLLPQVPQVPFLQHPSTELQLARTPSGSITGPSWSFHMGNSRANSFCACVPTGQGSHFRWADLLRRCASSVSAVARGVTGWDRSNRSSIKRGGAILATKLLQSMNRERIHHVY
jgi:hypothetical protein